MKKEIKSAKLLLQEKVEVFTRLIREYLISEKDDTPDAKYLAGLIKQYEALSLIDAGIFGIIDYSTFRYVFLTDNVLCLDLPTEDTTGIGLPEVASVFHPAEVAILMEDIIPTAIGFLEKSRNTQNLKNGRATFASRLRVKSGEYRWYAHHVSIIHGDSDNNPLLILKCMVEIEGLKTNNNLNLLLSMKNEAGIYQTVQELTFPIRDSKENLSDRELEVLNLISSGKTSKEIACRLGISIHTVNNHRKNIMKKKNSVSISEVIFHTGRMGVFEPKK